MDNTNAAYPPGKFRFWVVLGLVVLFFVGVAASTDPGITWDEPVYVAAGYGYCLWLAALPAGSLAPRVRDVYWQVNAEHPPAAKVLYGLAAASEQGRGLPSFLSARCVAVGMFVALVALVYLFTARHYGRTAGILAALSLALMPRVFGHGMLAALDVPVALAGFACILAFLDAPLSRRWTVVAGVLWGVALLTKLNAVLVPVFLFPWAVWVHRRRAIAPCVLFVAIGALVFVAGWPWLWHDTGRRIRSYLVNKTERLSDEGPRPTGTTNVPVHYLGRTYRETRAPWHYPIVMTLVTVPAGMLAFAAVGLWFGFRKPRHRAIAALLLSGALVHTLAFALPGVPRYDGVRLFLSAFPFIACLAGIGAAALWRQRAAAGRLIVGAVLFFGACVLVRTHPYELSYYNALVGGAWGARRLGFETTYWGDTVSREVMGEVNRFCPDGSTIVVWPPHLTYLERFPWMKRGLRWLRTWTPGTPAPDFLLLFPRQGYLDDFSKALLKARRPVRTWVYLGVPQCLLFDLRERRVQALLAPAAGFFTQAVFSVRPRKAPAPKP